MECDIRLEPSDARPLAVVRRRASLQELAKVVPEACGAAWDLARAQCLAAGRLVALYRNDAIDLEVGVELDVPFAGHGELVASALPAGQVAAATHFGPYQRLGETHGAIRRWCAEKGHTLAGPCWEVYGHWQEEWNRDPGKIHTDVFYLLRAEGSAGRGAPEGRPAAAG